VRGRGRSKEEERAKEKGIEREKREGEKGNNRRWW